MKKIVLLVASILAALQTLAKGHGNDVYDSYLVLSPPNGIYNHGSHYSHRSHVSSSFSIRHDSISNVTPDIMELTREGIRTMFTNDILRKSWTSLHWLQITGKVTPTEYEKIASSIKQNVDIEIVLSNINISSKNKIVKSFYNDSTIIELEPDEKCLFISYDIKGKSSDSTEFLFSGGKMIIPLSTEITTFYHIKSGSIQQCLIETRMEWMNKIIQLLNK